MSEPVQNNADRKKDPMILTKSVQQSVNDAGKKRIQLGLNQEEAIKLIEAITSLLENPRGVKLDIHISQKTSNAGRAFDSGIFFVKGIQDPATFTNGAPGGGGQNFKPKETKAFDVQEKIRKMKEGMGKPVA